MNIPAVALVVMLLSIVLLSIPVKGVASEVCKACLTWSIFVILFANLTVHVIHL